MQITEFADRFIAALEKGADALAAMAVAQTLQANAFSQQVGVAISQTVPVTASETVAAEKAEKAKKPKAERAKAEPPVEQAAPEISAEELKKAAQMYAARRKVAGSPNPPADVAALIQAHANVSKTADVPAELRADCLAAFEANWLPASEDDL